ncbi:leucine-rich repeat domain-containing protein [Streptomyces mirabilis]|uniref:leucine-rich repeat domain-containing protein n=1 Tax=Streptomyces mirabilis TaxID=68239 RepID=UPI003319D7B7
MFQSDVIMSGLDGEAGVANLNHLALNDDDLAQALRLIGDDGSIHTLSLSGNHISTVPEEIANLANLTKLNLSNNRLIELPEAITELTNLTVLNLSGNQLSSIPERIRNLANLTHLHLMNNQLTEFPGEIAKLANLAFIDLDQNNLTSIPKEMENLENLLNLDIMNNNLSELPEVIFRLTNLTHLSLGGNPFSSIPEEIGNLRNLTHLHLVNENLAELPEVIGSLNRLSNLSLGGRRLRSILNTLPPLANLTELNLSRGELEDLPVAITRLTNLSTLNLNRNKLTSLPEEIENLTTLSKLSLTGNAFVEVPRPVLKLAGLSYLEIDSNGLESIPETIDRLANLTVLSIASNQLTSVPETIGNLTNLTDLHLNENKLTSVPERIGDLANLTALNLSDNLLDAVPDSIQNLTKLTDLSVDGNLLVSVPGEIGNLTKLVSLTLSANRLTNIPGEIGNLAELQNLSLSHNQLTSIPEEIRHLRNIKSLTLMKNDMAGIPGTIFQLSSLTSLDLDGNYISSVPEAIEQLVNLRSLDLRNNQLTSVPEEICQLPKLSTLYLQGNSLTSVPETFIRLSNLRELFLDGNRLTYVPPQLGNMDQLNVLSLSGNPLAPELAAAAEDSHDQLMRFLQLLNSEGQRTREVKMVLVGEGEVGKSSLIAAMRDEEWVENRVTTHGIEVKPVVTEDSGEPITLNAWDFGGQRVYRPTHQLFFTAPAVYLVVWKPRVGPEVGLVDEWMTMIRHRAGSAARVHIVATHGGPGSRYAHIDEAAFRDRYGDMIVGFHHVDSSLGIEGNIPELLRTVSATAASIPNATRWIPRSWDSVRTRLRENPRAYLRYTEFEQIAAEHGLNSQDALSLARNGHALGHWIYYADDPGLAELVILKGDWLSAAIGLVLDDVETVDAGGLLPHRRLASVWNNPVRLPEHRFSHNLQQMFLRLMERFELSYRVPELTGGEPLSLVTQLLPSSRPDLNEVWDSYRPNDLELVQICRILDREDPRRTIWPDGLMQRLIVLFHRHSLGRDDVMKSVHWAGGLVLQDRYGARALLTLADGGVRISVRGLNPQAFLDHLVSEVQTYVEGFWQGLRTSVLVPCIAACPPGGSQRGEFDLGKLYKRLGRGKDETSCSYTECDEDLEIRALLQGFVKPDRADGDLRHFIRDAVSEGLAEHTRRILEAGTQNKQIVMARLEQLDDSTKEALSRAWNQVDLYLRALEDEAAEGPRLFSLRELDRGILHPGITTKRLEFTLWCEHSRRPVYALEPTKPDAGIYVIEVQREWWTKAAPFVQMASKVAGMVLPVSLSLAPELELNSEQWQAVQEQLSSGRDTLENLVDQAASTPPATVLPTDDGTQPVRAEGATLRTLHELLKEQDPTFADLRRVRDVQGRFLWVHRTFVSYYQPPLPYIPHD